MEGGGPASPPQEPTSALLCPLLLGRSPPIFMEAHKLT